MKKKGMISRQRAKIKVRKKLSGTSERPRLTVYRSLNHIYAQLIDDLSGNTVAAASSRSEEAAEDLKNAKTKIEKSKIVGALLAKKAGDKEIKTAVFDRNGYQYHGRIKAVAEGAREGGLKF